ncbi:hypothetical protein Tco_0179210 [Tanacetum coccineum]
MEDRSKLQEILVSLSIEDLLVSSRQCHEGSTRSIRVEYNIGEDQWALGAKGDAKGSTMFGIGGGIVSARVVSIVAWCCCGEASLEVRSIHHSLLFLAKKMEKTLEQSLGLLEFWRLSSFDGWKLVEIVNGVEGVAVNGITSWVGTSSLIWRIGSGLSLNKASRTKDGDKDWDEDQGFFEGMR